MQAGIIQDSDQDWVTESSKMGSIYRCGVINLAATGFADGRNGLFVRRDPALLKPIDVKIENEVYVIFDNRHGRHRQKALDKGDYYLIDTATWTQGVDDSPLCKRGWVVQERAMSIRTLQFGAQQLYWECLELKATEVYPKGLLRGSRVMDPKIFLRSGQDERKDRTQYVHSIRKRVFCEQGWEEEWRAENKDWNEKWGHPSEYHFETASPVEELSDEHFAKRMLSLQENGQTSADYSSDSPDPDISKIDYETWMAWKQKNESSRPSVNNLRLRVDLLEDCDLSVLDGLNIKGWRRFKKKLEDWGIGAATNRAGCVPFVGMMLEQRQWVKIVEMFSRCSLTFSHDKLVAISGMAQSLSSSMGSDYLAGLWRRDFAHQLLWKISHPAPMARNNGTRGPSWSWASVDGTLDIEEWDGNSGTG
jgi:hypothetical protein